MNNPPGSSETFSLVAAELHRDGLSDFTFYTLVFIRFVERWNLFTQKLSASLFLYWDIKFTSSHSLLM